MSDADLVDAFVRDGFIKLAGVIPRALAEQCAQDAWSAMGVSAADPSTWPGPKGTAVPTSAAVYDAAQNARLHQVVALLAGEERVSSPRTQFGLFIARFPSSEDSNDTGWHIDMSYHPQDLPWPEGADEYRVNVHTRGRALLLLPLFTEIGPDDAPTRIRVGSHRRLARELAAYGSDGSRGEELGDAIHRAMREDDEIALATGLPGDVYVCHPFLIHAAQLNRVGRPRLIAQPPIVLLEPYALDASASAVRPVELAILEGIAGS